MADYTNIVKALPLSTVKHTDGVGAPLVYQAAAQTLTASDIDPQIFCPVVHGFGNIVMEVIQSGGTRTNSDKLDFFITMCGGEPGSLLQVGSAIDLVAGGTQADLSAEASRYRISISEAVIALADPEYHVGWPGFSIDFDDNDGDNITGVYTFRFIST